MGRANREGKTAWQAAERRDSDWQAAWRGALAGAIGSVCMAAAMSAFQRTGSLKTEKMPRRIVKNAAKKASGTSAIPEGALQAAWMTSHLAYGALGGIPLTTAFRDSAMTAPVATGASLGGAIWAVSYLGWVPKTGLYPSVEREPTGRQAPQSRAAAELMLHAVYGISAAYAARYLEQKRSSEPHDGEERGRRRKNDRDVA